MPKEGVTYWTSRLASVMLLAPLKRRRVFFSRQYVLGSGVGNFPGKASRLGPPHHR